MTNRGNERYNGYPIKDFGNDKVSGMTKESRFPVKLRMTECFVIPHLMWNPGIPIEEWIPDKRFRE